MTDSTDSQTPKIHVDSDWKAQAQAEKAKLAEQAKAKAKEASATGSSSTSAGTASTVGGQQIPPASFEVLISTMATQALFALGGIPDPQTGQRRAHLGLARHHIDLLEVLREKTEGNLSDKEKTMLAQTLYELRSRYIQLSTDERAR